MLANIKLHLFILSNASTGKVMIETLIEQHVLDTYAGKQLS